jgi:hypothetical protein
VRENCFADRMIPMHFVSVGGVNPCNLGIWHFTKAECSVETVVKWPIVIAHEDLLLVSTPTGGPRPLDGTYHQPLLGEGYCIFQATNSICSQTGEMVKRVEPGCQSIPFRQTSEWVHRSMHPTLVLLGVRFSHDRHFGGLASSGMSDVLVLFAIKGDDQLKIESNRNDAWTQSTVEGEAQITKW